MREVSRVVKCNLRVTCSAACIAAAAITAQAQNSIPVFPNPVYVRLSTDGTTITHPLAFSSTTQNLSCPASGIVATVSSTPDGTGNVLVDNLLNVTLTQGGTTIPAMNICRGGVVEADDHHDCFTTGYQTPASEGKLTGQNPNGAIAASGGLPPIDISKRLVGGANTIKFDLVDTGGYLAATSIYLYTNCTSSGVNGGGTVTGNPITTTNPMTLTQTFPFSSTPNLSVQFLYDLSTAEASGTLTIPPGSTPSLSDQAIAASAFPALVQGTSFATSQCLVHTGELLDNSPACKLFTLTCTLGTGSGASGLNCPTSTVRDVVLQDIFDFGPLFLPDITYTDGTVFHQGFGFLEGSEDWFKDADGACTFEAGADQIFSCPENLLTVFEGIGAGHSTGTSQPGLNSEFISVGPVPEYLTSVVLTPWSPKHIWVNTHDPMATFSTQPPLLPPDFNGGNLNGYKPAAPYSITYGVLPAAGYPQVPSTEFPLPGDKSILFPGGCPTPGTWTPATWAPDPVQLHVDTDGKYLLHYFATDCAGTEELQFQQYPHGTWYTSFYVATMWVDTVKPKVVSGPTLACTPPGGTSCILGQVEYNGQTITVYQQNSAVQATFQCSDDFSGVAYCRDVSYPLPVPDPPAVTEKVNTSKTGVFNYSVQVIDAARNQGTTVTVTYGVL